jgi:hypothetical protein
VSAASPRAATAVFLVVMWVRGLGSFIMHLGSQTLMNERLLYFKLITCTESSHDLSWYLFALLYHPRKSRHGKVVDVRRPKTFIKAGFIPEHETALIIHGFNGTQTSQHIMYLKEGNWSIEVQSFGWVTFRDWFVLFCFSAYLSRQYNVIAGL